ncbi:MAG: bifunctional pyr operon transcriptional regulator/uracil phosphoribosyltransferase PyrR [Burkholderiales bacterium]
MKLPDANKLVDQLAQAIGPALNEKSALVGIHTGGVWIAQQLQRLLRLEAPIGTLDIAFYRDDYSRIGLHPKVKPSDIPFEVENRDIFLVDDVLYTGRTVRAAMNVLFDYGRPAGIRLVVLVDRGGRELPIAAQYVGVTLKLESHQNVALNRDEHGALTLSLHNGSPT